MAASDYCKTTFGKPNGTIRRFRQVDWHRAGRKGDLMHNVVFANPTQAISGVLGKPYRTITGLNDSTKAATSARKNEVGI